MARAPDAPSVGKMEFTLDLSADLGIDFSVSDTTKLAIGDAVADAIRTRTRRDQRPFEGTDFAPYSEKYAEKKGVSPNDVDLTLLSDMLDAVTVTDVGTSTITIGFDSSQEIPKAFNHHTGDTVPARPFFGIEQGELEQIKQSLSDRIEPQRRAVEEARQAESETRRLEQEAIDELVNSLTSGLFSFG